MEASWSKLEQVGASWSKLEHIGRRCRERSLYGLDGAARLSDADNGAIVAIAKRLPGWDTVWMERRCSGKGRPLPLHYAAGAAMSSAPRRGARGRPPGGRAVRHARRGLGRRRRDGGAADAMMSPPHRFCFFWCDI